MARAVESSLAGAESAFLREESDSAIHWRTWDAKTLHQAQADGRPIYLFIGSFLSELSHATTRQSFTTPEAIELLNENFICVIVDRDEQPDVAACAQHYLRTVKQLEGWPAHLWLTPELQPFEGNSYLPPSEEWGKASFIKVARQAREAWISDPAACRARAAEAVAALAHPFPLLAPAPEKIMERLTAAATAWRQTADVAHGGFGEAPKTPEPEVLRFLLSRSPADRETALTALRAIAAGVIHDPVDGGYFERTTDAAWRMPYFQKTLAMQARLALAFLEAEQTGGNGTFIPAARGALEYAFEYLALPGGDFAAAQDGTGETAAKYFAWTEAEIDSALGANAAAFKLAYGTTTGGNVAAEDDATGSFSGKNLLYRATATGDAKAELELAKALKILRTLRNQRAPLPRDERATAGAHGLMLAALSRAGIQLSEPRYLAEAARLFSAVNREFVTSAGVDVRRVRGGTAAGAPADYAALALGCREYSRAAKSKDAARLADQLLARSSQLFFDTKIGRFFAAPAALPVGIFARAPATADVLSAEALALQAGVPPEDARALRAGLLATLEDNLLAPGDVLLALGQPGSSHP